MFSMSVWENIPLQILVWYLPTSLHHCFLRFFHLPVEFQRLSQWYPLSVHWSFLPPSLPPSIPPSHPSFLPSLPPHGWFRTHSANQAALELRATCLYPVSWVMSHYFQLNTLDFPFHSASLLLLTSLGLYGLVPVIIGILLFLILQPESSQCFTVSYLLYIYRI